METEPVPAATGEPLHRPASLWPATEFTARLRAVGERRYHDKHPFHVRMNAGELSQAQVRGWVANRFYYQKTIPLKDAAILSNCPIREVRRLWLHRITDHDGSIDSSTGEPGGRTGGIEAWLKLGEAAGFDRAELLDERHVLPGVRFAVDAYLDLARNKPWPVAIASSLTEWFAPDLMAERIHAFERHYRGVADRGLEYFRVRVPRARDDSREALDLTLAYCDTPDLQHQAVGALSTKCDILWSMLDAMALAFGEGEGAKAR
jgi:pyrroloquinoline-quinone synthase